MSIENQHMDIRQFSQVYFLGIGGIGMSAIARWFHQNGVWVGGYDKTPSPLTMALQEEGMEIHFEDNAALIPSQVLEAKDTTLVVLTPAIPTDHQEWKYLRDDGFLIQKRSQVLGLISQNCFTVAVAGTHGKTTTSTLIAFLLKEAGTGCTAFLGGISANYNSNFLLSDKPMEDAVMVLEADEFDRSFLTLFPNIAVLTSTDADHLDIYGEKENMDKAYADFVFQVKRNGRLFLNDKINLSFETRNGVQTKRYGLKSNVLFATNIQPNGFGFDFELWENLGSYGKFHLPLPGHHNVENAIAALHVAHALGISWDDLRAILPRFKGIRRRFEKIFDNGQRVLIDDYAHHPTEISAAVSAARTLYPDRKLGLVFQPHLYTRTRDFALGFSTALNAGDALWLLDIYPAREKPISGVTSKMILDRVDLSDKWLVTKDQLVESVCQSDCEVILMLGAGDIDRLVQPMAMSLSSNQNEAVNK